MNTFVLAVALVVNSILIFADALEMNDKREAGKVDGNRRRTSDTPGMGTVYRHVQVTHQTKGSIRTSSLLQLYRVQDRVLLFFSASLLVDMVFCHPHERNVCLF